MSRNGARKKQGMEQDARGQGTSTPPHPPGDSQNPSHAHLRRDAPPERWISLWISLWAERESCCPLPEPPTPPHHHGPTACMQRAGKNRWKTAGKTPENRWKAAPKHHPGFPRDPIPPPALPSSSSSAVMDLERSVRVVLGALLGGGGAARNREGILHLFSRNLRGVARCRCHFFSTAWISSYSRDEESHCCRILLRLRVDANFFMIPAGNVPTGLFWEFRLWECRSPTPSPPQLSAESEAWPRRGGDGSQGWMDG